MALLFLNSSKFRENICLCFRQSQYIFSISHSIWKNQANNINLILLLSDDISLNPGRPYDSQIDGLS